VLTAADLPTVGVSGENASLDVVREIAGRVGPVETAVLDGAGHPAGCGPGRDVGVAARPGPERSGPGEGGDHVLDEELE
jgi:hypothetical protein